MCISLTHKVGSSPVNTGGTTANTGGTTAHTEGAPANSASALSNTAGAPAHTGVSPSNTVSPLTNIRGSPANTAGAPTQSSSSQYLQPPLAMPSLMPVPSSPLFGRSPGSPVSIPTTCESRLSAVSSSRPSLDIELATSFSTSARSTPTSALAKDSKSSPKQVGFNDIPSVYRINTDSPPNQRDPSNLSASEIRSSGKTHGVASKLTYHQSEAKSRNSPIISKVKAPRISPSTSTALSTNSLTAVKTLGGVQGQVQGVVQGQKQGQGGAQGQVQGQGIITNNNQNFEGNASQVKTSGALYSSSPLTLVSHNDIDHKEVLGEGQKVDLKEDLDSSLKSSLLKRTQKVKINSSD